MKNKIKKVLPVTSFLTLTLIGTTAFAATSYVGGGTWTVNKTNSYISSSYYHASKAHTASTGYKNYLGSAVVLSRDTRAKGITARAQSIAHKSYTDCAWYTTLS